MGKVDSKTFPKLPMSLNRVLEPFSEWYLTYMGKRLLDKRNVEAKKKKHFKGMN